MATEVERLLISLESRLTEYERSMSKARTLTNSTTDAIEKRFDKLSGNLSQKLKLQVDTRALVNGFRNVAAAAAAAFSVRAVGQLIDGYTRLQNSLKVAGLEGQALASVQDQLFAVANRNGIEIQSLATLYSRAALAGKELGISQSDLLGFTAAISDALRIQGGSAESAQGALLQLSQALGSGTVRAEEFNSILEGALPIAQAAARGIERFGGSVAKLRAAVVAGQVSSREFFQAILKDAPNLARQAASANLTLGQSFTTLGNQLLRFVGQTDSALGLSQRLAEGIKLLADNLDTVIPAITVVAAAFGGRYVAALTAAAAAKTRFAATVAKGDAVLIDGAKASALRAAAALEAARADEVAAAAALQRAKAMQATAVVAVQDTNAEFARAAVLKQIAALETEAAAATLRRASAEKVAQAAMQRTTLVGRGLTAVQSGLALVGGPVGLAFLAIAGGLAYFSSRSAAAEARTRTLNSEMEALGIKAKDAADALDGTTQSLEDLAADELRQKLRQIGDELERVRGGGGALTFNTEGLAGLARAFELISQSLFSGEQESAVARELQQLIEGFLDGKVEAQDLLKRLDEVAQVDLGAKMDELIGNTRAAVQQAANLAEYFRRAESSADGAARAIREARQAELEGAASQAEPSEPLKDLARQLAETQALRDAYAKGGVEAYRALEQQQRDQAAAEKEAAKAAKDAAAEGTAAYDAVYQATLKAVSAQQTLDRQVAAAATARKDAAKDDQDAARRAEALADIDREIQLNRDLIASYGQGEAALERIRAAYEAAADARRLGLEGDQLADYLAKADELAAAQRRLDLMKEGAELTASLRTEEEQRAEVVAHLAELLSAGAISQDTYNTLLERASAEYQRQEELLGILADAGQQTFDRVGSAITDAFVRGQGAAIDFGSIVQGVIADLIQSLIRLAAQKGFELLAQYLGGGGSGYSYYPPGVGPGGQGFTHFGGPRAAGGPVSAGKTYLVGEKGPEPFVPARGGTVLPAAALTQAPVVKVQPVIQAPPAPPVVVNVINRAPNTEAREERSNDGGGGTRLDVVIDRVVGDKLARQGTSSNRALRQQGIRGPVVRR